MTVPDASAGLGEVFGDKSFRRRRQASAGRPPQSRAERPIPDILRRPSGRWRRRPEASKVHRAGRTEMEDALFEGFLVLSSSILYIQKYIQNIKETRILLAGRRRRICGPMFVYIFHLAPTSVRRLWADLKVRRDRHLAGSQANIACKRGTFFRLM
jgi:hypothetical protein